MTGPTAPTPTRSTAERTPKEKESRPEREARVGDLVTYKGYVVGDSELAAIVTKMFGQTSASLCVFASTGSPIPMYQVARDESGIAEGTWRARD